MNLSKKSGIHIKQKLEILNNSDTALGVLNQNNIYFTSYYNFFVLLRWTLF